jgi:hypothetical protein
MARHLSSRWWQMIVFKFLFFCCLRFFSYKENSFSFFCVLILTWFTFFFTLKNIFFLCCTFYRLSTFQMNSSLNEQYYVFFLQWWVCDAYDIYQIHRTLKLLHMTLTIIFLLFKIQNWKLQKKIPFPRNHLSIYIIILSVEWEMRNWVNEAKVVNRLKEKKKCSM